MNRLVELNKIIKSGPPLKKRANCDGCRALSGIGLDSRCTKGYPTKQIEKQISAAGKGFSMILLIPATQCPKPRTFQQLFNADDYRPAPAGSEGDAR